MWWDAVKRKCDVQGEVQQIDGRISAATDCTEMAVVNLGGVWYCAEHAQKHIPGFSPADTHPGLIRTPTYDTIAAPVRSLLLDLATIVLFNHDSRRRECAGWMEHNPNAERDQREYDDAIKRIRAAVDESREAPGPNATPSGLDVKVSGGNTVVGVPAAGPITIGGSQPPLGHEIKNTGSGEVQVGDIRLKPGEAVTVDAETGKVVDNSGSLSCAIGPPYVLDRGAAHDRCGGKGCGDVTAADFDYKVGTPLRINGIKEPCTSGKVARADGPELGFLRPHQEPLLPPVLIDIIDVLGVLWSKHYQPSLDDRDVPGAQEAMVRLWKQQEETRK